MASDSYSLIEMKSGVRANNLAFVEYDLAVLDVDHSPELVIEELLPAVFDVFRESDPVADSQRDFLCSNTLNFPVWSVAIASRRHLSDDDSSRLPQDFPLFAAFKSFFLDSAANNSLGNPVKLNDLPWLISDHIALSGVGQFSR